MSLTHFNNPSLPASPFDGMTGQQAGPAFNIGDLMRLADMVAPTNFVPRNLKGKVPEIVATLLYGTEIGLPPMQALQLIDMIDGKPCLNAQGQRAAVLRAGHEMWVEHADATKAVVCGRRRGSDRVVSAEFTIEDAQRQQLTGKSNWKKMPREMLVARATTTLARQAFADVLMGVAYDPEELEPQPAPAPRHEGWATTAPVDGDQQAPAAQPLAAPVLHAPPLMSADNVKAFLARAEQQGVTDIAGVVSDATGGRTDQPSELLASEVGALRDALARAVATLQQDEAAETLPVDPAPAPEPVEEDEQEKPVGNLRGHQIHKQIAAMGYSRDQDTELILWASNGRTSHAGELTSNEVQDLQDELSARQQTPDGVA